MQDVRQQQEDEKVLCSAHGAAGLGRALEGVRFVRLPSCVDERGQLTAIEGCSDACPFEVQRIFYVHNVEPCSDRGGHAHRFTEQVLVAVHGALNLDLSDLEETRTFQLADPTVGLFIPRMTFIRMYDFTPGAVLLVLANTRYERAHSLRSWEEYRTAVGVSKHTGTV
jgi:hypothetical protein